jgi:GxxExxY protein
MVDSIEPVNRVEEVAASIIGAALEVRSEIGTGLLDEIYRSCIFQEFKLRGLSFKTDVVMPITYENINVDEGYIIDILVEDSVIVKIKPVGSKPSLYEAQVKTFLRHSGHQLGLLLDFDAKLPKNCIKRVSSYCL